MQKIKGSEKNLKQLLQNTKYTIQYYQRGYMWQKKQVTDLISDLVNEFMASYKPDDSREAVKDYGIYFMGSIVLAGRENAIIDGQQRLTSLTLLLMYLNNKLRELGQHYDMIEQMIISEAFGTKSFNINVEERRECMNALFCNNLNFDVTNATDSVMNLYERYADIAERFSEEISDEVIPHFCDWLAERVYFIEIIATAEQDAYKIFVTMNDRGLSLTPTEMLKGYILSEVSENKRSELETLWKKTIHELTRDDPKEDEVFIKAWLRAQYAQTIRDPRAGAVNQDVEAIGSSFHIWVREEREKLGLRSAGDYEGFVRRLAEFAGIYQNIRSAERRFDSETSYVFYNARVEFSPQAQILLAPICPGDSVQIITKKINMTAKFIEFYIMTRITNGKRLSYNTVRLYVFDLIKAIRHCTVSELKEELARQYDKLNYSPSEALKGFVLNRLNKKYIRHLLARITGFIEESTGTVSHYREYIDSSGKNPYEIEHIISDHYEHFSRKDFQDQIEFARWRNSIGALLLLRKKINASLNDSPYTEKLVKYCSTDGNIYSASLGEATYENNPGFMSFIRENHLTFKPCQKFSKQEIRNRIDLLVQLFRMMWNSDMFR